jgi:amino acid transporter
MFCLEDIDAVITSPFGALLSIFYQATNNKAGAVCLLIFPVVSMAFAAQGEYADSMLSMLSRLMYAGVSNVGILTTSSRMTYAFARDRNCAQPCICVPANFFDQMAYRSPRFFLV